MNGFLDVGCEGGIDDMGGGVPSPPVPVPGPGRGVRSVAGAGAGADRGGRARVQGAGCRARAGAWEQAIEQEQGQGQAGAWWLGLPACLPAWIITIIQISVLICVSVLSVKACVAWPGLC